MKQQQFNRNNFHRHTFCVFTEMPLSSIEGKTPDYKSKSGSSYYFTEVGVYRLSNHWGRAAHCKWRLQSTHANGGRTKLGYAAWSAFHRDNETEKLYFIVMDNTSQTAHYMHKDSEAYRDNYVLRTASETTKVIKSIRALFKSDDWARHLPGDNIDTLRAQIIAQLVTTEKSLTDIKRELQKQL